jgi:hypothetical protein
VLGGVDFLTDQPEARHTHTINRVSWVLCCCSGCPVVLFASLLLHSSDACGDLSGNLYGLSGSLTYTAAPSSRHGAAGQGISDVMDV